VLNDKMIDDRGIDKIHESHISHAVSVHGNLHVIPVPYDK